MRIFCTAILVSFFATTGLAQPKDSAWHFGVKGDVNMSAISGNGMSGSYRSGFQAGVYAERVLGRRWSIQPEMLVTQSNYTRSDDFLVYYNDNIGNPFASKYVNLTYISLPVMVKYNVTSYLSILAGLQYSHLIYDAESLLTAGDGKAFKKPEFSGNIGVQATVGRLSVYARYNQGFSNINNIDGRYSWMSRHIQTGLAIRIL